MIVTVCQTAPVLLDLQTNLEEIIAGIKQAKEKGASLVVFPELALTGYFVGQKYHEVALRLDSKEIETLVAATKGTAAVVGFIEESPSLNFYNSALIAVDGEIVFTHRKLNLPNYGVFEERKYFAPGKHIRVFKLECYTVAIFICNDLWHPSLPYLGVCQKADLFVSVINSSQEAMGSDFSNIDSWETINKFYSRVFGIYNVCANRVGSEALPEITNDVYKTVISPDSLKQCEAEKNYKYWGGSEIIDPFGQHIAKAPVNKPDTISGVVSRDLIRRKKILLPYLKNDDPYFTHRELERILYDKAYPLSH